jgi:hypothetical protein
MTDYKNIKEGQKFKYYGRTGEIITTPSENPNIDYGLYYADIKFKDGTVIKDFMICRKDIEWIVKREKK